MHGSYLKEAPRLAIISAVLFQYSIISLNVPYIPSKTFDIKTRYGYGINIHLWGDDGAIK